MTQKLYALMDIGSHSLRLVIFQKEGLIFTPILNESQLCGLGDTDKNGALKPEKMKLAYSALQRFYLIAQEFNVQNLYILATAAVREAPNGLVFCQSLKENGIPMPRILSGSEEATFSAHGVLNAFPDANGIVMDMGGGSIEFAQVAAGQVGKVMSLPLGPLRIKTSAPTNPNDYIKATLKQAFFLWKDPVENLYLVGGSPRALAYITLMAKGCPTEIVHGAIVKPQRIMDVCDSIRRKTPRDFSKITTRLYKRRHILPTAALALRTIIQKTHPQNVHVCGYGLREGFLNQLNPVITSKDPLLSSCDLLEHTQERQHRSPQEHFNWFAPHLLQGQWNEAFHERLLHGFCRISDCGWTVFPEHQAEFAFQKILHSPSMLCTHTERFILSVALYFRYGGPEKEAVAQQFKSWLAPSQLKFAIKMGNLFWFFNKLVGPLQSAWHQTHFITETQPHTLLCQNAFLSKEQAHHFEKEYEFIFGDPLKISLRP